VCGAEVILVLSANSDSFTVRTTVPSRACENQVFIAYINHAGYENGKNYCGMSTVVSPTGEILLSCSKEEESQSVVDLDMDHVNYLAHKVRNPFFLSRRPELYERLLK